MINAANQLSVLDHETIRCRNNQIDKQLLVNMLRSVNVEGDKNCFFRALSVGIHGHEKDHINLRHIATKYIASQTSGKSPEDCIALRQHTANVMRSDTWPREDVSLATANCQQGEIGVFMYVEPNGTSPKIYSPPLATILNQPPLQIAFNEPGHYRCVARLAQSGSEKIG